jgi:hypothetical protein
MPTKKYPWYMRGRSDCYYVVRGHGTEAAFTSKVDAAKYAGELRAEFGGKAKVVPVGACKRKAYRPRRR